MKEYGLEVCKYCSDFFVSRDIKRIKEIDRKSSDHTKKSRKRHRDLLKGFERDLEIRKCFFLIFLFMHFSSRDNDNPRRVN